MDATLEVNIYTMKNFDSKGTYTGGQPAYLKTPHTIIVNRETGLITVKSPKGTKKINENKVIIGRKPDLADICIDKTEHPAAQFLSRTHGALSYERENGKFRWFYTQLSQRSTYLETELAGEGMRKELTAGKASISTGLITVESHGKRQTAPMLKIELDLSRAF